MLIPQTGVLIWTDRQDHAREMGIGYCTEVCTPVRMGPWFMSKPNLLPVPSVLSISKSSTKKEEPPFSSAATAPSLIRVLIVGLWAVDGLGAVDGGTVICRWKEPRGHRDPQGCSWRLCPTAFRSKEVSACKGTWASKVHSRRFANEQQSNREVFFVCFPAVLSLHPLKNVCF